MRTIKRLTILAMLAGLAGAQEEPEDARWQIPPEKENFHVFLLMGQSNMAGGIPGRELTEEDKKPVPHIVLRRGKGWIPAAHPLHLGGKKNGFGLGLPFAKKYLENHPGVTVGLIPCASGGKRIDLLRKGSNIYKSSMGKAKLAIHMGTIKGVLWHQGEADTISDERTDSYEEKLHQLIADLRADLGVEELPFIVGNLAELYGIGENGEATPEKVARVRKVKGILKSLPDKVPHTGFVDSNGLDYCDRPKCTHFDRDSYIILGRRYAETYERLVHRADRNSDQPSRP